MALMQALAALVRAIRNAKALSQEQLSGSVEARHLHNIENARSSITLDKLQAISDKLEIEPAALVVLATALEKGMSDEQILDLLRIEFAKIDALGARDRINEYYQNGKVTRVRPGRQIDPQKLASIRKAKAAGESQASVSARLGLPKSTVGRWWHMPED
ncbi:helix-turn-helix domain-containing protein [Pseudomonas putida]|uniref:helix-turn-helix domain-containing protein n=1 Tax=Pseudomonas putida TaxID=303 RepID=UPI0021F8D6B9|nr:helix-turn-helix transcriptional regulator [Pseudomonas putida]MDD1987666.1 helix-turn-helix domain-containing protein [Pseudomonas putida]HDS1792738.1 helix-turn-helix transcriptional regulator [Pseudomonas putida]